MAIKRLRPLVIRILLNILFWSFITWIAHAFNYGNSTHLQYKLLNHPIYWPVMLTMLALQMTLMYVNNLFLIPRFLANRRYAVHIPAALLLVFLIAISTVFILKAAIPHIDVTKLQTPTLTTGLVTSEKGLIPLLTESQTYIISDVCWLLVFTMAWYVRDYSRQRKIAEEARRQQSELELMFLKSQLNPHFLFNTLNNLYGLSLKKSELAPSAILKLSSILRYLLYESSVPLVSFNKEAEVMQSYIDVELLRHVNQSRFLFTIEADDAYMLPPLLWLPVLENVFKHGSGISGDDDPVHFSFTIRQSKVHIHSSNPLRQSSTLPVAKAYVDFPAEMLDVKTSGIGLANLRKRLQLLFSNRHSFVTIERDGLFVSDIIIDLSATL